MSVENALIEKAVERLALSIERLIAVQEKQGAIIDMKLTGVNRDVSEVKMKIATLEAALLERCAARGKASAGRDKELEEHDTRIKELEESKVQAWTVLAVLISLGSGALAIGNALGLFSGKG